MTNGPTKHSTIDWAFRNDILDMACRDSCLSLEYFPYSSQTGIWVEANEISVHMFNMRR